MGRKRLLSSLPVHFDDGKGGWEEIDNRVVSDGKGGVGILSRDGKQYNPNWITGLNAPKGMGMSGNRLYVADMANVVVIDKRKGNIIKSIAINKKTP